MPAALRKHLSRGSVPVASIFVFVAVALLIHAIHGDTPPPQAGTISTFAGGSADGAPAANSTFSQPFDAALAPDGSIIIADTYNNRIRAIDPNTGVVRTVAGSGDVGNAGNGGPALNASLNFPLGVAVGSDGAVFFSDNWNNSVRRVDPVTGIITLFAGNGGPAGSTCTSVSDGMQATAGELCGPTGLAVDGAGNVYIAETDSNTVRRVDHATGVITSVPRTNVTFSEPWGLALDSRGNLLVTESSYQIRYVNLLDQPVTIYPLGTKPVVIAGKTDAIIVGGNGIAIDGDEGDGGPATDARIDWPKAVRLAANGDLLFTEESGATVQCPSCPGGVTTQWTMLVRRVDWQSGVIQTIAGNKALGNGPDNVPARQSGLLSPETAFADSNGNVVVVDRGNGKLRTIFKADGVIHTAAGADLDASIPAGLASVYKPEGVAAGPRGIYFTDPWNLRVRRVNPDRTVTTVAGSALPCIRLGAASYDCGARSLDDRGDGGPAVQANFFGRTLGAISVSSAGLVVVIDAGIRVINDSDQPITLFPQNANPLVLPPGTINTITGSGHTQVPQTGQIDYRDAAVIAAKDVTFAPNGDMLIAEAGLCRILRLDVQTGQISVITGLPPQNVVVPQLGVRYTVPENYQDGPIDQARFFTPYSVVATPDGNTLYVADVFNNRIRKVDLVLGQVTTIAGNQVNGYAGDGGPAALATLSDPSSIRLGPDGSIYFMDFLNQRVRKITVGTSVSPSGDPLPDGIITTVAGSGPTLLTGTMGATCADYSPMPCGHYSGDGGPASAAQINLALAIDLDQAGNLYIADTANSRIRKVLLNPSAEPTPTPNPKAYCTLPGLEVASDEQGDQTGAPANSQLDILSVSVAEPFTSASEHSITFTMKVANLNGTLQPNSSWKIVMGVSDTAGANRTIFFQMDTTESPTAANFTYGFRDASGDTSQCFLGCDQVTGSYSADGTITIKVDTSHPLSFTDFNGTHVFDVNLLPPGAILRSINGETSTVVGANVAAPIGIDSTDNQSNYTTSGNASCAAATPTPTASPSATPSPSPIISPTPAATPTPTPTGTPGVTPTPTANPTATVSPTATATVTPTATASSTARPTPEATATPTPSASPARPAQLLNISTRMDVENGDNALIGGFIVTGQGPKNIVLRALGPSLNANGIPIPGRLTDPMIELHDRTGRLMVANDDWKTDQQAEIEATGLAPTDDHEAALVRNVLPGAYTAIVRGKNGERGIGLVEAYDLSQRGTTSRLANISTRGLVGTGDSVMIGGFIAGSADGSAVADANIVVRALGPSLNSSGVTNALQNPLLELHDQNGSTIATNDDWRQGSRAAEIESYGLAPDNDAESALLISLPQNPYTAIVRGVNDTTGVALIEVYNLQ